MAFTSSNPVSIGDPTKKVHYDAVFDNTAYNLANKSVQNLLRNPMAVMSNSTLENHPDGSSFITGTDSDFSGAGNWVDGAGWSVAAGVHRATATGNDTYLELTGLIIGRIYRVSQYCSAYSAGVIRIAIKPSGGGADIASSPVITPVASTTNTFIFKASATALRLDIATSGLTADFDNALLYEVVPACIAADTKCFDMWQKDSGSDVYRGVASDYFTTHSEYYCVIFYPAGVNDWIMFNGGVAYGENEPFSQKFGGRTVTVQAKVIADVDDAITICAYDFDTGLIAGTGADAVYDGGGTEQTLEATFVCTQDQQYRMFGLYNAYAGAVDAKITDMQISFAAEIGEGNYQPPPPHFVEFEIEIDSNALFAPGFGDVSSTALDLEVDSDLAIPATAQRVYAGLQASDTGSSGGSCRVDIHSGNPAGQGTRVVARLDGLTDSLTKDAFNYIRNDIVTYILSATGAGTLSAYLWYTGCLLK